MCINLRDILMERYPINVRREISNRWRRESIFMCSTTSSVGILTQKPSPFTHTAPTRADSSTHCDPR